MMLAILRSKKFELLPSQIRSLYQVIDLTYVGAKSEVR
jgi:hypothetical protein